MCKVHYYNYPCSVSHESCCLTTLKIQRITCKSCLKWILKNSTNNTILSKVNEKLLEIKHKDFNKQLDKFLNGK
jgi:hypothetical protein